MRRLLKKIANNDKELGDTSTLLDQTVLEEIKNKLNLNKNSSKKQNKNDDNNNNNNKVITKDKIIIIK
jgi:hypothetical protein